MPPFLCQSTNGYTFVEGPYVPWLHSLAITHSCIYILYKYSYIWIAHPSSLFSIPYSHHQSQWTLTSCDTKETSSCPPEWLFHTTLTVQQAGKWGQPMLSTSHTPSSHEEGGEAEEQAGQQTAVGTTVSTPETITMPDLKRLCCLFSTFLLLPSPKEVSEIKSF